MQRFVIGLLVAVPLCSMSEGAAAQEISHPMYLIRQEFVKPAGMSAYETETRRWLADLGETRVAHDVQWVTVYGPELGYSYVVPIEGLGGIDRIRSTINTSRSDASARWSAAAEGEPTPIDHIETFVVELRPDLSYLPRTVELDLTLPFRKYHWYHTVPGLESQFEDIATRLVALYEEYGIVHGYRFYELLLGTDLPVFLMVERARDEADYAARTARIRDTVGDEADALFGQMLQFTRRVDVMEGTTRGDLSHPPLTGPPRVEILDIGGSR